MRLPAPIAYQPPAAAVAPNGLRREISEIAAKVLAEAQGLTPSDRQFLGDVQREERYQGRWITRLVLLGAKCPEDSDAFAIAARLEAWVRAARAPRRGALTLRSAIEDETRAQGEADLAELEAAIAQDDVGVLARCERSLLSHRAKLDALLETVQVRRAQLVGATA